MPLSETLKIIRRDSSLLELESFVLGPHVPPADAYLMRHVGLDGLDANRWEQGSPLQIGQTDTGRKVLPRTASIACGLSAPDAAGLEQKRRTLSGILAARTELLYLQATGMDGTIREAACTCIRPPVLDTARRLRRISESRFQLHFPDPIFRSPAYQTFALMGQAASNTQGFVLPLPIPFDLSGHTWGGTNIVTYDGVWDATPLITVTGPLSALQIINRHTGSGVRMSAGYSLPADTLWAFDPDADRIVTLTAPDGTVSNGAHTLDMDATDIAGWRIVPGPNEIIMAASNHSARTSLVLSWRNAYPGI